MKKLQILLFAIMVSFCWGCASTGSDKLDTKLNQIHRNMDGESVVQTLGEPKSKVPAVGSLEVWIYNDEAFSQKKNAMVPVEYILYMEDGQVSSYDYVQSGL